MSIPSKLGLFLVLSVGVSLLVLLGVSTDGGRAWLREHGWIGPRHTEAGYQRRVARFAADNAAISSPCTILLGDSLVALFPKDRASERNWILRGISGDRVIDLRSRLDPSASAAPCGSVALLIGTNDLVHERRRGTEVAGEVIEIARELAATGKRVMLHTIPPTREPYEEALPRIAEANRAMRSVLPGKGVVLVDLHRALADANGRLEPAHSTDGLHFTESGYAVWEDRLRAALASAQ